MKFFVWGVLLIALLPLCFASISVTEVKGYVNNERNNNIDVGGGDLNLYPDDLVDLVIKVDNTENTTVQTKYRLIIPNIDDDDDLTVDLAYGDISANTYKQRTISFTIPANAVVDNYDSTLRVWMKYSNATEVYKDIFYTFNVKKRLNATIQTNVDLQNSLKNLSTLCGEMVTTTGACFGYINTSLSCRDELSTVKEERGKAQAESSNCNENLQQCKEEINTVKANTQSCENSKAALITLEACSTQKAEAVKQSESGKNNIIMILIGGGILFFFWQNKKKQNTSTDNRYYYDKK